MFSIKVVVFQLRAKIVKGTEKGSWKPHWLNLFQSLKDTVPPEKAGYRFGR